MTGTYYVISLGFRIEIKPASLRVNEQLYLVFLHSGCTQNVVRESRKIYQARGGGASAHPTAPKFHTARNKWRTNSSMGEDNTIQCKAVQCS